MDEPLTHRRIRLRSNVAANLAGRIWTAGISLAAIPIYLKLLGIEAYGLIGIYIVLAGAASLLDLGLSTALNREFSLARTLKSGGGAVMRRVLLALERFFWPVALCILVALSWGLLAFGGGVINPSSLDPATLRTSLLWMAAAVATQFPISLYIGGFLGLERQVELNGWLVLFSTLRAGGAVLVTWLIEPTLVLFFGWMALVNLAQATVMALRLRSRIRSDAFAREGHGVTAANAPFDWRRTMGFAIGTSGIAILGALVSQVDRFALGTTGDLSTFGHYSLAWSVAGALGLLAAPISTAVFPRLSLLAAGGNAAPLAHLYRLSLALMSAVLAPAALMLVFFSEPILRLWTHDPSIAAATATTLSILALGSLLNVFMQLPFQLQFAFGWTRLALCMNLAAAVLVGPLTYWLAVSHGPSGAASGWVVLNAFYILVGLPLMHRRLLAGIGRVSFAFDMVVPATAAALVLAMAAALVPEPESKLAAVALLATFGAGAMAAAALAAPSLRNEALAWLQAQRQAAHR